MRMDLATLRKRIISLVWLLTFSYLLFKYFHPFGLEPWMLKEKLVRVLTSVLNNVILTPIFALTVLVVYFLERFFPADPNQKFFSKNFRFDFFFLFFDKIGEFFFIVGFVSLLNFIYVQHLSFLTIHAVETWPLGVRIAFGVLFFDLLKWTQHAVKHNIPWLWYFHMLHHSSKKINMFTGQRYHFVDYIFRHMIMTLPLLMLQVSTEYIVFFQIMLKAHSRIYHSNIKSNFGFLRYIIVTPQSHRIHHSIEPKHRNKNYGAHFTVWDYMFGTQYRGYDEYPESGIEDTEHPQEDDKTGLELIFTLIDQLLYPFRLIGRSIFKSLKKCCNPIVKKTAKRVFTKQDVVR